MHLNPPLGHWAGDTLLEQLDEMLQALDGRFMEDTGSV